MTTNENGQPEPTTFTVSIRVTNAAFKDRFGPYELSRLLHELAHKIGRDAQDVLDLWEMDSRRIMDSNGTTVGEVKVR